MNAEAVISIPLLIIYYAVIIGITILWIPRRRLTPLNGRSSFFVYAFLTTVLLYGILHILGVWVKHDGHNAVINQIQLLVYPFFLQLYLWRLWQLFFLFNLSGSQIKSYTQPNYSDWFLSHRKWGKNSFLVTTFVAVALVEYAIFLILLALSAIDDMLLIIVFICVTLVYVVLFIILVVKIRKVRDAFGIKREFLSLGLWILFLIVVFAILAVVGVGEHIGDFFGLITYFGCTVISLGYPLVKFFRREKYLHLPQDTEENLLDIGGSSLRDYLVSFLEERFSVQYLFFVEDVKKFKENPSLEKAQAIYNKYIRNGAEMELDVSRNEESLIEQEIAQSSIAKGMFQPIQQKAEVKLDEMMYEFYQSRDYLEWSKNQKKDQLHQGLSQVGVDVN